MSEFRPKEHLIINEMIKLSGLKLEVQHYKATSRNYAILVPPLEDGATMNNQIISMLFELLISLGWNVLRFNFTKSSNRPIAHLHEANAVLDWYIGNIKTDLSLVCGYASGAALALELLMRRPEINYFIALALNIHAPANLFSGPCAKPGLFIHGSRDKIAPLAKVQEIVRRLQAQNSNIQLQIYEDDHFFKQYHHLIKQNIKEYLLDLEHYAQ